MAAAASGPAPFSTVPDAPRSDDAALVAALRADLAAAGFTVDRVTDLVGPEAMSAWSRDQAVPARRALRERAPVDTAFVSTSDHTCRARPRRMIPLPTTEADRPGISGADSSKCATMPSGGR